MITTVAALLALLATPEATRLERLEDDDEGNELRLLSLETTASNDALPEPSVELKDAPAPVSIDEELSPARGFSPPT